MHITYKVSLITWQSSLCLNQSDVEKKKMTGRNLILDQHFLTVTGRVINSGVNESLTRAQR